MKRRGSQEEPDRGGHNFGQMVLGSRERQFPTHNGLPRKVRREEACLKLLQGTLG